MTPGFYRGLYKDILNEFIKMPDISKNTIEHGMSGLCYFKDKSISLEFKDNYIQVRRHYNMHDRNEFVTLTGFDLDCSDLRNPKFSLNTAKEIYKFCYVFLGFYRTCDEIDRL